MQVICRVPSLKIQAAQHLSSCLWLHLDQLISHFRVESALNRTGFKLSNASALTRALILALFATVSAILCNFAGFLWVQPLVFLNWRKP